MSDQFVGNDAPSQEVREAWEQAHAVFCPRASRSHDVCSAHLRPGDRWMLAHVFPPGERHATLVGTWHDGSREDCDACVIRVIPPARGGVS